MATDPTAEGQAEASAGQAGDDRGISVSRDASGNAFVSGDNNNVKVVIYQSISEQRLPEEPHAKEIGENPYLGLAAFHESDADRFFGREKQIARLWEKLRDLVQGSTQKELRTRVLPILGPSGCGKSSVARAGLVPELARRPLPGLKDTRIALLTPGTHPLEALASILARIVTNDPAAFAKAREIEGELKLRNDDGNYDGLRRIADNNLPNIATSPLIVLIDQFEEIYSLCEDKTERNQFIENLLHASADPSGRVSAVLTLRTDFVGETQTHEALNGIICAQQVMIPSMNEEELRAAITKPAELARHPLDEATVELLIKDTKNREGTLPLMQFALTKIWDGFADGKEAAETYREIGGVGGALAGEAQRIYDDLDDHEKRIAKRAFLGLVQLGEGTRDTRRRAEVKNLVSVGEDASEVERVIRRFADRDARLITLSSVNEKDSATSEEAQAVDTAEVTHEALFDHWDQLNGWLDENREDIRFSRRLDEAASTWNQQGRPDGGLWRPPNLDLLRQYHKRFDNEMTPLQIDFFIAAKKAESTRQLILRGLVGVAAATSVAAIVALIFALISRGSAIEARDEAMETERAAQEGRIVALVDAILLAPPTEAAKRMRALTEAATTKSLRDYAIKQLKATLSEPISKEALREEQDAMASAKANIGVALLKIQAPEEVRPLLKHSADPALRSYLIHRFNQAGADAALVASQLETEQEPFIRQALILSLGEFDDSDFPNDKRETLIENCLWRFYRTDPEPAVHAASEWLLRKWGHDDDVQKLTDEVARDFRESLEKETKADPVTHTTSDGKSGWYVNSQGQTMVMIKGPVEFLMGSPKVEKGRDSDDETQQWTKIVPSYAIADKEVTNDQFRRFLDEPKYQEQLGMTEKDALAFLPAKAEGARPVVNVTWYMAAAYCNWLTEQEMKWEDEKHDARCYLVNDDDKFAEDMKIAADFSQRAGYRLPTEAEWEYACRGGSSSSYCFGETAALTDKYGWYFSNSNLQTSPVGALKANDFGVFDMHGNVLEWCQEVYHKKYTMDIVPGDLTVTDEESRVLRSGAFSTDAPYVRPAFRNLANPDYRVAAVGFRVARTYP